MRCLLTFREVMASWRATTLLPEVEGRHALCTVLEGETHRKQAFCTLRRHGIMTERLEESVDEKCKNVPVSLRGPFVLQRCFPKIFACGAFRIVGVLRTLFRIVSQRDPPTPPWVRQPWTSLPNPAAFRNSVLWGVLLIRNTSDVPQ